MKDIFLLPARVLGIQNSTSVIDFKELFVSAAVWGVLAIVLAKHLAKK